ncbi:MAG TPA: metalloregulator ArsR/SmtB family transcription factor [Candidatus Saccharimonadia bacterium]|nr:metalloregulator ArsR/SmtB family transcription factor [Candidatus Saccharimonadia bacterium]
MPLYKTGIFVTIVLAMKNIVAFAQALADETRWRIVQLVFNEPLCICELADILDMPQSSVSSHVQVIKKAGLLESERCGKWIYYRLSENHRRLLQSVAEFFEVFPAGDAVLRADAKKASSRLAERDESCCPLPLGLAKLKPLVAKRQVRNSTQTTSK